MAENKRGELYSKASTDKTDSTLVMHVQNIDSSGNVVGGAHNAIAFESITVANTAIGLTSGTYGTATKAEMTLETAQIRVRKDGTNPTSSVGHIVNIGDTILLNSAVDLASFKAIRTGDTSGVLRVTYSS